MALKRSFFSFLFLSLHGLGRWANVCIALWPLDLNNIRVDQIDKLFDGISNQYDRFNHITSMGIDRSWRRQAVGSLPVCHDLLDVAVGTGDLTIEALRQQKVSRVVGIDISDGMMRVAKAKVERLGLQDKVTLLHADCAQLPFADGSFDAITCGYGVRNFAQLDQSLAEMYRVLRPGGQLRILEFTYPTNPIIRFFYDFYLTKVMPIIGKKLTQQGDSFVYFMNSIKRFDKGKAFLSHLDKVGFADTRFKKQTFGISSLYIACKR